MGQKGLVFFLLVGFLPVFSNAGLKSHLVTCEPSQFYGSKKSALESIIFDYEIQKWLVAVQCGPEKNLTSLQFDHLYQAQNFHHLLKQRKIQAQLEDGHPTKIFVK